MTDAINAFFTACRGRVDRALDQCLPQSTHPLHDALRYAVLGGGKRIRPILTYGVAEALGGITEDTDRAACAVELIHAYSLIHDDLPAMDNDDLRRGNPTCHIAFGEATAILAGDALQALAFEQITTMRQIPPAMIVQATRILAKAAGPQGMVYGQAMDLDATGEKLSLAALETMHLRKTGDLISASIALGAISARCSDDATLAALRSYATAIGLAFQIKDDILDDEGNTAAIGKRQGADRNLDKSTYTSLLGIAGAKVRLHQLQQQSLHALTPFDDRANYLRGIAHYIVARDH